MNKISFTHLNCKIIWQVLPLMVTIFCVLFLTLTTSLYVLDLVLHIYQFAVLLWWQRWPWRQPTFTHFSAHNCWNSSKFNKKACKIYFQFLKNSFLKSENSFWKLKNSFFRDFARVDFEQKKACHKMSLKFLKWKWC